ncbi:MULTISPECIES: adenosylcobinamide-phosphate synthase CbiB [Sphingobium]|uniref:Cobalamin biosynthesis protein CobD n=1 Tax=Sphingobium limneticum TaxID=1007511 RepID=A0A5J5HWG9_9SPHN|nr:MULTISPECIES: adenosylcobinamide-phosphate synthase CbiB [Sphingobium]KAA9014023.1 cobalamin biosynthesis protein CobD [Sphingobium limneticum]KAA9014368.1 cobalamin biosynthesis protein CobD [Sphingobium limneticum]KAA9027180.1 cobalamin biosynthesis protein CobD [Sphingobium limneticum]BBD02048.1 adenosylcobinamide-phosphate synthase [Sphingobium sp. YG1]
MVEPVAVLALAVEAVIGWPNALHRRIGHPVGAFAAIIAWCEKTWNRPESAEGWRRLAGILCVLLLLILAVGGGLLLEQGLRLVAGRWAWIGITLMAVPGMAAGSLYRHVRAVAVPLHDRRIEDARAAVSMIVGRDTARLDEAGVARAAIESLAESFCDGVVAPLFWLMLGGLPGLWAYKAINTADSLIGHREPRWRAFGWAAARLDDLLNLIPARLSGLLLCVAGGGGWGTMLRDAGRHASPNAGWPEAAMAGALHFSLAGPIAYDGVAQDKAWIGSGRSDLSADDIDAALRVYLRACLLLGLIAGLFAWRLS